MIKPCQACWRMALVVSLLWPCWALSQSLNQLQQIDFQLDSQRHAQVVLTLSNANVVVDAKKQPPGLVVNLPNTQVSNQQLQLLQVSDFATLVTSIEVSRTELGSKLAINTTGDFSFHHALLGNTLHLTLAPQASKPLFASLERMSMNFQDIELRRALQLVADYNDFNLVVSDSVAGNLTLRLDDVPWPQVFDLILQVKGLKKHLQGNVVLVTTSTDTSVTSAVQTPMATKVIRLNYAKVDEIATMLAGSPHPSLSPQVATQSPDPESAPLLLPVTGTASALLSAQGSFAVDPRTNTVVLRDTPAQLEVVSEMIKALDVPVKQVQIEARIVSLSEGSLDELGVRWGVMAQHSDIRVGGSIEDNHPLAGTTDEINLDQVLNVNLAATAANTSSIAFQIATLGTNTLLDLELSALQSESKAEIISSPSLLTTNKQPAYIEQGTEIPYVESASSGATSVAFKKAVLSLKVTPQITPNNRLVLDLSVTQDRPGEVVKTGTGEAVAIHTQRIGTQVLVSSGETVVLGGIYQHSFSDTLDKVPLLGDLPIVGSLFRRSYQKMGKSELLIFVTPKVVTQ